MTAPKIIFDCLQDAPDTLHDSPAVHLPHRAWLNYPTQGIASGEGVLISRLPQVTQSHISSTIHGHNLCSSPFT